MHLRSDRIELGLARLSTVRGSLRLNIVTTRLMRCLLGLDARVYSDYNGVYQAFLVAFEPDFRYSFHYYFLILLVLICIDIYLDLSFLIFHYKRIESHWHLGNSLLLCYCIDNYNPLDNSLS